MSGIEATVFFSERIFVYDLRNAKNVEHGYRAADYSSTPHMWAGQLRINSGQNADGTDKVSIILEHDPADAGKTGTFARCDVRPGVVQEAIDSSRYFILRIDNEATGQFIMLLIGFPNKADAFNFRHELASLAQKKKEVIQQEYHDYSLKEKTISLDVNALRGKQPVKDQDAPQTVSRPTNVEKISLSAPTQPVRGRRTNNNPASTSTPQQTSSTLSTPHHTPQQQQFTPQQSQQQSQQQKPKVDIFADMMNTPSTTPQQQQQPVQQQQNSGNNLLDSFFSTDTQPVQKQSNTTSVPTNNNTTTQTKPKSNDPFDFDDFNF